MHLRLKNLLVRAADSLQAAVTGGIGAFSDPVGDAPDTEHRIEGGLTLDAVSLSLGRCASNASVLVGTLRYVRSRTTSQSMHNRNWEAHDGRKRPTHR